MEPGKIPSVCLQWIHGISLTGPSFSQPPVLSPRLHKFYPQVPECITLRRIWRGACWDLSSGGEEGLSWLWYCGGLSEARALFRFAAGQSLGWPDPRRSGGLCGERRRTLAAPAVGRGGGAAADPVSWVAAGPVPGAGSDVSPVGRWRRTPSDSGLAAFATAHPGSRWPVSLPLIVILLHF